MRGRRLFQVLVTGSRSLNILFCYPLNENKEIITSKYTKHGLYKFSKDGSLSGAILFLGYFSVSISLALELESSLISFAG